MISILDSLDISWGDGKDLVQKTRDLSKINPLLDLSFLGAPESEFLISPLTIRATLLGAKNGRHFYQQELRELPIFPQNLLPEIEVGTLAHWSFGALAQAKYFSFFQDAPCPAYNPNHRTKWRAHEILHGANLFYWRPKLTRFSFYIGVRLNEILPVVHWYYFDEIDRPRCPQHLYRVPREFCVECDRALPYWNENTERSDAIFLAEKGFEHFDLEMEACRIEMESGFPEERFLEDLNSSKDAIGYLRSHWNRVTSWSFGHWMELFSVPGVDHIESLEDYDSHILKTSRSLFNKDLEWEVDHVKMQQKRKQIQDLSYRYLLSLEELEDNIFEKKYDQGKAWLEHAAMSSQKLLQGEDINTQDLFEELQQAVDEKSIFLMGFSGMDASLSNIEEGLASAGIESDALREFVNHSTFYARGPLAIRYRNFLGNRADENIRLVAAMSKFPRIDLRLERFGMIPDNNKILLAQGNIAVNTTRRYLDDGSIGFYFNSEFRIFDADPDLDTIFRAIDEEDINLDDLNGSLFWEALHHGLIGWYP